MRCFCAIFSLLLMPPLTMAQTGRSGTIRGTVVDEYGNHVADAQVFAEKRGSSGFMSVGYGKTDGSGVFQIEHLPMGEYEVSASKPESYYRSTRRGIFAENRRVVVKLVPENASEIVPLQFTAKAGALVGVVTDADTGQPLKCSVVLCNVVLARFAHPNSNEAAWFEREFTVLIPADTDVMVSVRAEGYKPWIYADPAQPSRPVPLRLKSGSELRVDIVLTPGADSPWPPLK